MQEETWSGEGRDIAYQRTAEGEKLTAGHGEFDGREGGGRKDVGVPRAAVGVSLEKEETAWWVGTASKGRRRRLG